MPQKHLHVCPYYEQGHCAWHYSKGRCQGHRLNFELDKKTYSCSDLIERVKEMTETSSDDEIDFLLTSSSGYVRNIVKTALSHFTKGEDDGH